MNEENIKYLLSGQKVVLKEKLSSGEYLVLKKYECLYGDESYMENSEPVVVDKIYDSPPTTIVHKDIELLNERIKTLCSEKDKIIKEINGFKKQRKETEAHVNSTKSKAVKLLYDFDKSKITHFFMDGKIVDVKDREYKSLRLESVFYIEGGSWRTPAYEGRHWLNMESSGSWGNSSICIPCYSYNEAKAHLIEHAGKEFGKTKDNTCYNLSYYETLISRCERHNINVPTTVIELIKTKKQETTNKKIKKLKEELSKLEDLK